MTLTANQTTQLSDLVTNADFTQLALINEIVQNLMQAKENAARFNHVSDRTDNKTFRAGDKVMFKPRKTKPAVYGTVKRVNRKTITITKCSDNGPGWRMPAYMLTKI